MCPGCGRYFCRECVTEHDSRVLCARCISQLDEGQARQKKTVFSTLLLFIGSVIILWFGFYYLGQLLLGLPDAFHEGTLWKDLWNSI